MGVIFVAPYLGGTFCTLESVADHIEHVARIGGEDCVALGSDFDGFLPLPRGLRDAGDLPRLTEILWRRGWRGARLTKLLGENALRFFAASDAREAIFVAVALSDDVARPTWSHTLCRCPVTICRYWIISGIPGCCPPAGPALVARPAPVGG